jgi:hypothetical protein
MALIAGVAALLAIGPMVGQQLAGQQWLPSPLSFLQPHDPSSEATGSSPDSSSGSSSDSTAAALLTAVQASRLLVDVEALTFERYAEADRARARDYIAQALEAAGWITQFHEFGGGVNLYAERSGTDPAAGTILLGAHYDTVEVSPGADDNATAVATVLEAARLLKQPTARTLQLVFFDLEEQGLLGSRPFVAEKVEKQTLRGAVILDMLGYACEQSGCQTYPPLPIQPPTDRGNFLAVLGDQGHPELIDSFVQPQTQPDLPLVLTLPIPTLGGFAPDVVRSDHAPFWKKGIGAVLVTDTANFRNPHYHQASDTFDKLDPNFLVGSAQTVINAVARLLQN